MKASKRKKLKTVRDRNEKRKHKPSRSYGNENQKDEPYQKRHRKHEKFNPDNLSTTIITARRLTVGVKGIFGNAKNSNSVYREIKERVENRKLSNEVASEIEFSLSRIVPNRNVSKHGSCSSSFGNSTHTRACNSTPADICTSAGGRKSNHNGSRLVDEIKKSGGSVSCSFNVSNHSLSHITPKFTPKVTPEFPPKTPYMKIAAKIKRSLRHNPSLNAGDMVRVLKEKLYKVYKGKYTLSLKPLFRRRDYSHAAKERCKDHNDATVPQKSPPIHIMDVSPSPCERLDSSTQTVPSQLYDDVSVPSSLTQLADNLFPSMDIFQENPNSKTTNTSTDFAIEHFSFSPHVMKHLQEGKFLMDDSGFRDTFPHPHQLDFKESYFTETSTSLFATTRSPLNFIEPFEVNLNLPVAEYVEPRPKYPSIPLKSVHEILTQPLSEIRVPRKNSNSVRPIPNCVVTEANNNSDNWYDDIPSSDSAIRSSLTPPSSYMDLEKPTLDSPSPPLYHRMNMY